MISIFTVNQKGNKKEKAGDAFENLAKVIRRLRSKDGCPWDKKQTHESLKPFVIEETYEVVDAIDKNDKASLREELGDLLLQILLHSQIASETEEFDITDVVSGLSEKLIGRHPHVFGDVDADTANEVLAIGRSWNVEVLCLSFDTPMKR